MNLLFDQNISHRILPNIQDIFPNAKQVRELGLENLADKEIWDYAKKMNSSSLLSIQISMIYPWSGEIRQKLFGLEPSIRRLKILS